MIRNSGVDRRPEEAPEEIRVTDRRRINLNDKGDLEAAPSAEPNLKPSYVEELESRTQAAENKLREIQTRFDQMRVQLQRETDETRQRLNRAADERGRREQASFISGLLPVLDNLQRAIEAAESHGSADSLIDGVRRTANSFEAALAAAGVEPVPAIGEIFNPEAHEAVDIIPVDPELDGLVVSEYTRGYKIGDRLIRPARVQVGSAQTERDLI